MQNYFIEEALIAISAGQTDPLRWATIRSSSSHDTRKWVHAHNVATILRGGFVTEHYFSYGEGKAAARLMKSIPNFTAMLATLLNI